MTDLTPEGRTTVGSDAHSRLLDALVLMTEDYQHYSAYDTVFTAAAPESRDVLVAWLVEAGIAVPVGPWSEEHPTRHYFWFAPDETAAKLSELWAQTAAVTKVLAALSAPLNGDSSSCVLCGAYPPDVADDSDDVETENGTGWHTETCPWRMAREAVDRG